MLFRTLLICVTLFAFACVSGNRNISQKNREFANNWNKDTKLSPEQRALGRLQNSVVFLKVYVILDTQLKQILPEVAPILQNTKTGKLYYTSKKREDISILVNVPPGEYVLRGVQVRNQSIFGDMAFLPRLTRGEIDFGKQSGQFPITVGQAELSYAGDWSIYAQPKGIQMAPPEYRSQEDHEKLAVEGLLTDFAGSRWGKMAYRNR